MKGPFSKSHIVNGIELELRSILSPHCAAWALQNLSPPTQRLLKPMQGHEQDCGLTVSESSQREV